MFSESVTSSLYQGEMRLQKSVSTWQIRPGGGSLSPPTGHRAVASQWEGPVPTRCPDRRRPQGQPRLVPPVCAYLFIGAECETRQVKNTLVWDLPGGPEVRTLRCQCGAKVQSPVRELISHYAEWHIQKIKQAKNKTKQEEYFGYVFCDGLHQKSRTTEKQNVLENPRHLAQGCHAHSWSIKAHVPNHGRRQWEGPAGRLESRREGCCGLAGEAGMKSMGETRRVALLGSTQPWRAGAGLSGLSQQGPPMCTSPAQATSGKPMTNPPTD